MTGNAAPENAGRRPLRVGRIGYLNVLPIHYPLEHGLIAHDFTLVPAPPAELNVAMARGKLDLSGCSCIEYARHAGRYRILPNLGIASRGPVQSVLLLCRTQPENLDGADVLLSAQSHTSVALVDLILRERLNVRPRYATGDATATLERGERPAAILTIGDEALRLRRHPDYPQRLDLGEAWYEWTGLPFVFAVWIAGEKALAENGDAVRRAAHALLEAKKWGQKNLDRIAAAAPTKVLTEKELRGYFAGLAYDLGADELAGLRLFYAKLAAAKTLPASPRLRFLDI